MPSGKAEARPDGAQVLRAYFAQCGWDVVDTGDGALNWAYGGASGTWFGQSRWLSEPEQLLVYAVCADAIPQRSRARLAKFVAGVNVELVVGSFELDDQLRFRIGVAVGAAELSADLVRRTVETAVATVERHRAAIAELLG
jgi:hypothetical protein